MSVDENRPPYVVFEMRGVEDRAATIANGYHTEKEVAFAVITRPGSRDTLEKEAEVWLKEIREKSRKGESGVPMTWSIAFDAAYKQWLAGETATVKGLPIKGWTAIGAGAQKTLLAAGIVSVEDLADISDSELQAIGTGAMSFKMKAKAYLAAANGPGKQAEAMIALTLQVTELVELTKAQAKEIDSLRKQLPEPAKAF